MIVGGDSDTIGAITGGIAEAMYDIPEYMKDMAKFCLPDDVKNIEEQFYSQI